MRIRRFLFSFVVENKLPDKAFDVALGPAGVAVARFESVGAGGLDVMCVQEGKGEAVVVGAAGGSAQHAGVNDGWRFKVEGGVEEAGLDGDQTVIPPLRIGGVPDCVVLGLRHGLEGLEVSG
jgi:hypothetical protein